MGVLPKFINYEFGSLPLVEILAVAQFATKSSIAIQKGGKIEFVSRTKTIRVGLKIQSNWFGKLVDCLESE